jgi:hypothetical protein
LIPTSIASHDLKLSGNPAIVPSGPGLDHVGDEQACRRHLVGKRLAMRQSTERIGEVGQRHPPLRPALRGWDRVEVGKVDEVIVSHVVVLLSP